MPGFMGLVFGEHSAALCISRGPGSRGTRWQLRLPGGLEKDEEP